MKTDWITFFQIMSTASGAECNRPTLPYFLAATLNDANTNCNAERFNMLPLPGGRGDLGKSELAERYIRESAA